MSPPASYVPVLCEFQFLPWIVHGQGSTGIGQTARVVGGSTTSSRISGSGRGAFWPPQIYAVISIFLALSCHQRPCLATSEDCLRAGEAGFVQCRTDNRRN
eukprot:EG_transcript_16574